MKQKPASNTVLYDGDCSLCTFQMKVITWLDWFNTVTLIPIADPRAAEIAPGIAREDLLEAIHCVSKSGKIYRGARCIRFIGMRMPLAIPFALILWFPGIIYLAEIAYRWISRNRHLLSRVFGCKGACAIMPARKREDDTLSQGPPKTAAAKE
jgi:predicted DCC family thiol-disulfide oxidoreductase YuxK